MKKRMSIIFLMPWHPCNAMKPIKTTPPLSQKKGTWQTALTKDSNSSPSLNRSIEDLKEIITNLEKDSFWNENNQKIKNEPFESFKLDTLSTAINNIAISLDYLNYYNHPATKEVALTILTIIKKRREENKYTEIFSRIYGLKAMIDLKKKVEEINNNESGELKTLLQELNNTITTSLTQEKSETIIQKLIGELKDPVFWQRLNALLKNQPTIKTDLLTKKYHHIILPIENLKNIYVQTKNSKLLQNLIQYANDIITALANAEKDYPAMIREVFKIHEDPTLELILKDMQEHGNLPTLEPLIRLQKLLNRDPQILLNQLTAELSALSQALAL